MSDPTPAPVLKVKMQRTEYSPYSGQEVYMVDRPSLALQDFHAQVEDYIHREEKLVLGETRKERVSYILGIAVPLLLLFVITLLANYLYRNRKRIWDRSVGGLLRWKGEIAQSQEDKRVRRIAIDEAVKLSVQNTVNSARSDDTLELKNMIASALKRGDSEAAEALSAALDRIRVAESSAGKWPGFNDFPKLRVEALDR